jgi:hypothetical protein
VLDARAAEEAIVASEAIQVPEPVDTDALQAQIAEAETIRKIRDKHQARAKHEDDAESFEAQAKALTAKLDEMDKAKADAIATAALPVPGLSFGDGCIMFGGVPFEQVATSKKIKVSVAVGMALNPDMRIMTIDEGSELDSSGLAILEEMAAAADFQVWIARVDEHSERGFVLEDGNLRE